MSLTCVEFPKRYYPSAVSEVVSDTLSTQKMLMCDSNREYETKSKGNWTIRWHSHEREELLSIADNNILY